MQSRAFPAFTFNPAAGSDWASRFRIADNPQPTNCWTAHEFHYEDQAHQRMTEDICFTFVDFVACDQRYAEHFAKVPRDRWHQDMVPANIYLESVAHRLAGEVPYILMIDRENVLHRVIIDERIIRAARRYGQVWHSLQELGGIENSHARALLAKEREALEQEKIQVRRDAERSTQADAPTPPVAADQMASDGVLAEAADEEEPRSPDEAYIETARCTACNECFEINNRMFAYDENQQAYFADLDAGTFKELVESAESCQVSIIHPGKPRYPDEPDVESLIERAAAFN